MAKSFRNVVAENASRFKAKRISNDRGNRRPNDTKNTKSYMEEMDDDEDYNSSRFPKRCECCGCPNSVGHADDCYESNMLAVG